MNMILLQAKTHDKAVYLIMPGLCSVYHHMYTAGMPGTGRAACQSFACDPRAGSPSMTVHATRGLAAPA